MLLRQCAGGGRGRGKGGGAEGGKKGEMRGGRRQAVSGRTRKKGGGQGGKWERPRGTSQVFSDVAFCGSPALLPTLASDMPYVLNRHCVPLHYQS